MRVSDLDRDMRDVIPTGVGIDSEFLYARMTELTLGMTEPGPGRRVLDVASGLGNDALQLAEQGARVIGIEPSSRMLNLAREWVSGAEGEVPRWTQAWSDGLPFADASFDAVYCKGSIDHFDRPQAAIDEMARVTRTDGRVVLAIANFESLAVRLARGWDEFSTRRLGRPVRPGRRLYDVPSDHFTRYDVGLMREQAERALEIDRMVGTSLLWGFPGWSKALARLPEKGARRLLQVLDAVAARLPSLADVVVISGRPRRAASASR